MTRRLAFCFLLSLLHYTACAGNGNNGLWRTEADNGILPFYKLGRVINPAKALYLSLDESAARQMLFNISGNIADGQMISLPVPDGSFRSFRIGKAEIMEAGLAAKYPDIKAFTAVATDNQSITAKISYTPYGFQAQVYNGAATYLIDPLTDGKTGYYQCYYKKDCTPANKDVACSVADYKQETVDKTLSGASFRSLQKQNGTVLKKYRLALACTHQYAAAVAGANPTKAAVLAKMVVSINRVNGIYERELGVTMQLVNNTDALIIVDSATDPYSNDNGYFMLGQNQLQCSNIIGSANYDIGHVFSTGGGGIANLLCVCLNSSKAKGVTGLGNPVGDAFDVDFVAHEMGHQFGANHTFNANTGSCNGNVEPVCAFEPGSGSTIMAYAGYCGSTADLQSHSNAYFHAKSLTEITNYITLDSGAKCPVITPSGNAPATIPPISHTYYIPFKTPFELGIPGVTDQYNGVINYCWEEYDLGDTYKSFAATRLAGPIFRSLSPDTSSIRVFPTLPKLVQNITSYLGEKLPDTSRELNFKLTVRDVYNGVGSYNMTDDTLKLKVVYTGTPFEVASPANDGEVWTGGATHTINWNVSATDVAPINCSTVSIYLSLDSGYHFPVLIKAGVPNTGSASVPIPNIATNKMARIKVKGDNNVFFDMSNFIFTLQHDETRDSTLHNNAVIYPIPATDKITISTGDPNNVNATLFNTLGQKIWQEDVLRTKVLPVTAYSGGIYYLRLIDTVSKEKLVKTIVINR